MNLYRILPTERLGYDAFGGAIVAAPDAVTAARMHPRDGSVYNEPDKDSPYTNGWFQRWSWSSDSVERSASSSSDWCKPWNVQVEFVGVAAEGTKQGVILAQFNAG